ncbi:MAG: sulfatase [Saprospiraceae bacterium]|nr:sulfatase [Saprospiraceae bacterium]
MRKILTYLPFIFLFSISLLYCQEKPNVVFIAIDDLNDYVGCMQGSIQARTPNIDRLAEMGTLFTNAHCQAPICGPSRASIMTGLYPSTTGNYLQVRDKLIKSSNAKAADAVFMPDYFEQHGYQSLGVGKIYHNGDGAKTFDQYGGKFDWFGPKPEQRLKYDPAWYDHKIGSTQTDWGAYPSEDSLMTDYKVANWAIDQLHKRHEMPFFLAVGFLRPHVPWYVPQHWLDQFPINEISTPPYLSNDLDDIPPFGRAVAHTPCMPTTEEMIASGEWKNAIQAYLACIAFMDAQVGKVLSALEQSKYANNTIVVLWSDHGYHLGEKNRFAKQALWERNSRTVLIFKTPKAQPNQECHAPVQLLDIYPTLLELCDLPKYHLAEGHSLVPLIKKPNTSWPYPALTFYGEKNIAIRDRQYRLIQYENGSQELYNMSLDPNEWSNLAPVSSEKGHIARLQQFIPRTWAPLSKYSDYKINAYFTEKSSK